MEDISRQELDASFERVVEKWKSMLREAERNKDENNITRHDYESVLAMLPECIAEEMAR